MHKAKLVTGVVLIFLVGALAGALGTEAYLKHRIDRFAALGHWRPTKEAFLMRKLTDELDLKEAQRVAIERIVEASEDEIYAIRREYLPQIKEIMDESFALMKERLEPDQQKKLDELYEKFKNRHARALTQSLLRSRDPNRVLSQMKERLKLTENQEAEIRPIVVKNMEETRRLVDRFKEEDRPDMLTLKHELLKMERNFEKRLSEVLSEKQIKAYRQIREEAHLKRREELRKLRR